MRFLLVLVLLAGCSAFSNSEAVKTTGMLGCAPEQLTSYQIQLVQKWQKGEYFETDGISRKDREQVVQYITRCGSLDPETGVQVIPAR